jgi:hypothetical protein
MTGSQWAVRRNRYSSRYDELERERKPEFVLIWCSRRTGMQALTEGCQMQGRLCYAIAEHKAASFWFWAAGLVIEAIDMQVVPARSVESESWRRKLDNDDGNTIGPFAREQVLSAIDKAVYALSLH